MRESTYKAVLSWLSNRPLVLKYFKIFHRLIDFTFFVLYVLMIIFLIFSVTAASGNERIKNIYLLIKITVLPMLTLISVTIIKMYINQKRPYEVYDITPLFEIKKRNDSFPSRHTVCASVIAVSFLYMNTGLGIAMIFFALTIAACRVISGMHFIKDVLASVFLGCFIGMFIFIL